MKPSIILALGLLAVQASQAAVTLNLRDTLDDLNSVSIFPGDSFQVTLSLNSNAELTTGISYLLEALGSGNGQFRVTVRNVSGSAFPDLTTDDSIVFALPVVLDPVSDNELGGLVADLSTPNIASEFKVATYTIQALPGIAPGEYSIGTNTALAFDENFEEIPVSQATYNITVVPEPATTSLLSLALAALLIRRRK